MTYPTGEEIPEWDRPNEFRACELCAGTGKIGLTESKWCWHWITVEHETLRCTLEAHEGNLHIEQVPLPCTSCGGMEMHAEGCVSIGSNEHESWAWAVWSEEGEFMLTKEFVVTEDGEHLILETAL